MNITFIDTQVFLLSLAKTNTGDLGDINVDDLGNIEDSFSFTPFFSDENPDEFLIVFSLSLNSEDFSIATEYAARFNVDGEIDEEFKNSNFVKINAPAIAYPYLRAFVSNLTLSSGFSPIVLPTMNFTKGINENK